MMHKCNIKNLNSLILKISQFLIIKIELLQKLNLGKASNATRLNFFINIE